MSKKFDLTAAIAAAATDPSQWEAIAKHFIAKQAKPRAAKASGPQTWAHVRLVDGRDFLTSAYARKTPALTADVHASNAQFRARMEDSGDRDWNGDSHPQKRTRSFFGPRVFLDPTVEPVDVEFTNIITEPADIERVRDFCFEQRGRRQGWWIETEERIAA